MDGRLARRQRKAPSESIHHEAARPRLPVAHEEREHIARKPSNTAGGIAAAFAEAARKDSPLRCAANELARELKGARGKVPPAAITGILARWDATYSQWTVFNRRHALRKILLAIDAELRTSLAQQVGRRKVPPARATTIQPEELARMLAIATPPIRLFLLMMSVMGLRFAEAQRAKPEHFNPENQTLTLTTKGGKEREFPVPDEIAAILRSAPLAPEGWTFIEALRGRTIHRDQLRNLWRQTKKRAGVREEVNPHDLRRTAANRLYTLTKDVLAVKELLAHDNLNSTAYYLQPYAPDAMKQIRHALRNWTPPKGEPTQ